MTSESSAKDGWSGHEGTKSGNRGRIELADYPSVTGELVPTREASGPGQQVSQTRAETETGWYDFSVVPAYQPRMSLWAVQVCTRSVRLWPA